MIPGAILATFATYRLVPSRSVVQLVLEVPCEQQAEIFAALGYPLPGAETWVAVARLQNPEASPEPPARSPAATPPSASGTPPQPPESAIPKFKDLVKSERAKSWFAQLPEEDKIVAVSAMLCKDVAFQTWFDCHNDEDAAAAVRRYCDIDSRAELADNPTARQRFYQLMTEFQTQTGRLAEPRGIDG